MSHLSRAIEEKCATVAVIGLGYVGLPVALSIAEAGFLVVGIDTNQARISSLNQGISPFPEEPEIGILLHKIKRSGMAIFTDDLDMIRESSIQIIAVPTPVDGRRMVREYLDKAIRSILDRVTGNLVLVESTIAPGTMEEIIEVFAESERDHGVDYLLAHAPERLSPGMALHSLQNHPRIIGGVSLEAAQIAHRFYSSVFPVRFHLTDHQTAEIVKVAENSYRDVQIAFANELAVICEGTEVNVWEARRLINTAPGREVLFPGPGVGGPCLTKDPWLLVGDRRSQPESIIREARRLNDRMPLRVVEKVVAISVREGMIREDWGEKSSGWKGNIDPILTGIKIGILGQTYRVRTTDIRESPAIEIGENLVSHGARVVYHDPASLPDRLLIDVVRDADFLILAVPHHQYFSIDWDHLGEEVNHRVLIDACGVISDPPIGWVFSGVGRGDV